MTDPIYKDAKRLPGWRKRFAEILVIDVNKKFDWGDNDCLLGLVVPVVFALIGEDIGAKFRGKYADHVTASVILKAEGYTDLEDAAGKYFTEIPVAKAHIGDIVSMPSGFSNDQGLGVSLGIVNGERAMFLSRAGLASVSLMKATKAFRVGNAS